MKVIYADFNDFDERGNLPLTCSGSVNSLRALSEAPRHGEEVWLTDGQLWAKARVFTTNEGIFEARYVTEPTEMRP